VIFTHYVYPKVTLLYELCNHFSEITQVVNTNSLAAGEIENGTCWQFNPASTFEFCSVRVERLHNRESVTDVRYLSV